MEIAVPGKIKLRLETSIAGVVVLILISQLVSAARAGIASSSLADASTVFNGKCAKCHGRDGRSRTVDGRRTHSRNLTRAEWQNDVSDERIFNSISNGKGKMPSFKKNLSENQIDELVTYVRRLRK